jgi:integrase
MAKMRDGLVQRGSKWYAVVRVVDPDSGLSRPRWLGGFRSQDEAKAARDEARVQAREGSFVDKSSVTVTQYLRSWLAAHQLAVKPKTYDGYRTDVEAYVIPHIGGRRLQSMRPAVISTLYADLLRSGGRSGKPLSPRTVQHVHRTLHKALQDAVDVERLLPSNPAGKAKVPRVEADERGRMWTSSQLRMFLEHANTHRLGVFFRTAAYTGARRGELLALRWHDIDMAAAEITFARSVDVLGGVRVEGSTKGGRSRVVPVDEGTVASLRTWRKQQAEERLRLGAAYDDTDLIFTQVDGRPIHPDTVSQLMPRLAAGAAVPVARLHDLRHLHATTLLLAGVPVHVVAARLGHADPAITLRVYAHVIREASTAVADVFAKAVSDAQR